MPESNEIDFWLTLKQFVSSQIRLTALSYVKCKLVFGLVRRHVGTIYSLITKNLEFDW